MGELSSPTLTAAQLDVLTRVAKNRGAAFTAYMLGRQTCEALRKRGLITAGWDNKPLSRFDGNPYIAITEVGIALLRAKEAGR